MVGEVITEVNVLGSDGYLSFLDSFLDGLRHTLDLSDDVVANVVISLSEALNNAFIHGNQGLVDVPIHIKVFREGLDLCFSVSDNGSGFDYELLREDLTDDLLDVPGGRGIFIMRALADKVDFSNSGSTTTLRFRC
jgi:serine/threonine-protein kinase RsbW